MAALRREVSSVSRPGSAKAISIDLKIRFTGRDGSRKTVTLDGVGLPRERDIRRRKGETARQAFDRAVQDTVRKAIYGVTSAELGVLSGANYRRKAARMSRAQARELLNKAKRTRDVRFTAKVYRED